MALQVRGCRYGHAGGARDADALPGSHYVTSHPAMGARIDAIHGAARQAGMKIGPVLPLSLAK
ncbi:hypothetical protein ACHAC9_16480 [Massilia sp. CMS3.1]|uniref:hypothetical protein n=1 Tax=Massilia sp. CMS3.1 TaxID=3373083 RepID=UPI003EE590C4